MCRTSLTAIFLNATIYFCFKIQNNNTAVVGWIGFYRHSYQVAFSYINRPVKNLNLRGLNPLSNPTAELKSSARLSGRSTAVRFQIPFCVGIYNRAAILRGFSCLILCQFVGLYRLYGFSYTHIYIYYIASIVSLLFGPFSFSHFSLHFYFFFVRFLSVCCMYNRVFVKRLTKTTVVQRVFVYIYIYNFVCVYRDDIYIYIYIGWPGFWGPAVTRVAKREIELHFGDVCVIPSRAHTRSGWPVEMKFPSI